MYARTCVCAWMDRWEGGKVGEWMRACVDRWTDGRLGGRMRAHVRGWVDQ